MKLSDNGAEHGISIITGQEKVYLAILGQFFSYACDFVLRQLHLYFISLQIIFNSREL
jgi:hypothetical protein